IANFVLAIFILFFWFLVFGKPILEPRIANVQPEGAAAKAGFQPGDLIRGIDGSRIESFDDVQRIVMLSDGIMLTFIVFRVGKPVTLPVIPLLDDITDRNGTAVIIIHVGIKFAASVVAVPSFGVGTDMAERRSVTGISSHHSFCVIA